MTDLLGRPLARLLSKPLAGGLTFEGRESTMVTRPFPITSARYTLVVVRRILIVEDERLIALDLQRRLTQLGYTVVGIVASGAQVITAAFQLQPDLVLMDIRLQGEMDGIEAALYIQVDRSIPIIYLTAYVDDSTRQRAQATSPWGFLRKPFHVRDLQAILNRYSSELQAD